MVAQSSLPAEQLESAQAGKTARKRLVLGCGALVYDLVALIKQDRALDQLIDIHCLPAKLHNTPQFIAAEVDNYLYKHAADYADIFVAYADCGTAGELDRVLNKYHAQRLPGAHCYEFFAGSAAFSAIIDDELGCFFLTDFLVKFFDRLVVQGLGLDRYPELFDVYFKHYKKMVYLAQTDSPELQQQARVHAASFGLEYEYRYVGIKGLLPLVENIGPEKHTTKKGLQEIAVEVAGQMYQQQVLQAAPGDVPA